MISLALADNRKDTFALGTALAGVSEASRLKLTKLLHAVHREVQEARRVNNLLRKEGFQKIATVSAVMAELSNMIDEYVGESRHSFKEVNTDLEVCGADVEDKLKSAESHLLTLASGVANSTIETRNAQDQVTSRVHNFISQANKQDTDLLEGKGAKEVRASNEIEELETQAQLTINRVAKAHESFQ
jgi:hypothetical protein